MLSTLLIGPACCAVPRREQVVSDVLNVPFNEVLHHPDFFMAQASAEGVDEILSFASQTPMIGPYRCAILSDLDLLTPITQTKLLKVLEDSDTFVLVSDCRDDKKILDTVKSRVEVRFIRPQEREEFLKAHSVFEFIFSGGYEEVLAEKADLREIYEAVWNAIRAGDGVSFLRSLKANITKKGEGFFELHKEEIPNLLLFMKKTALEAYVSGTMNTGVFVPFVKRIEAEILSPSYSKNAFFSLLARLGEIIERGRFYESL